MEEQSQHPGQLAEYTKAIVRLQSEGFQTELWIDTNTQMITFRWVKKGSKWHISGRGLSHLNAVLESMGRQAQHWATARELGTANENNYAVPET